MKNVSYGDYIAFESQYFTAGNKISAKALESRAGCKVLLDIAKEEFDCNLYMIFTAQREIGMRGASVALYGRKADAALILDGFESADMYGMSDEEAYAELGGGAVLEFMDRYAIPDRDMTARYERLLCESGVKLQKKKSALGLTDAGAVQRSECGVLTACIGIPVRYTHTPQCMADRRDIKALGSAAEVFIKGLEEIIR